jgi:hypothetical protein
MPDTSKAAGTDSAVVTKSFRDGRYSTMNIKARAMMVLEPLLISMYPEGTRPLEKNIHLPNGWHVSRQTGAVWVEREFGLFGGGTTKKKCRNPVAGSDPIWLWTHWENRSLATNETLTGASFRMSIERLEEKLTELENDPEVQYWDETKMVRAHEAFFGSAEPHQFYVLGQRSTLLKHLWSKGAYVSGAELERWEKEGNLFMNISTQIWANRNIIITIESKLQRIVFWEFSNLSNDLPRDFTLDDIPQGCGRISLR